MKKGYKHKAATREKMRVSACRGRWLRAPEALKAARRALLGHDPAPDAPKVRATAARRGESV